VLVDQLSRVVLKLWLWIWVLLVLVSFILYVFSTYAILVYTNLRPWSLLVGLTLYITQNFLYKQSGSLVIVLLTSSFPICMLFLFLCLFVLLHFVRGLVATGVEKMKANTLGLFMILGEMQWVCHCGVWCSYRYFHRWPSSNWGSSLNFKFARFYHKILSNTSLCIYWNDHIVFNLYSIDMMNCTN